MNQEKIAKKKQPTEEQKSKLLTVHEVANQLRVDDTTVRRWIKSGALEAIELPHRGRRRGYRVREETLDGLLNPQVAQHA